MLKWTQRVGRPLSLIRSTRQSRPGPDLALSEHVAPVCCLVLWPANEHSGRCRTCFLSTHSRRGWRRAGHTLEESAEHHRYGHVSPGPAGGTSDEVPAPRRLRVSGEAGSTSAMKYHFTCHGGLGHRMGLGGNGVSDRLGDKAGQNLHKGLQASVQGRAARASFCETGGGQWRHPKLGNARQPGGGAGGLVLSVLCQLP